MKYNRDEPENGSFPTIEVGPPTPVLKTSVETEGVQNISHLESPPDSYEKFSNSGSNPTETIPILKEQAKISMEMGGTPV